MVARAGSENTSMFYSAPHDSYSYRLWTLANVWTNHHHHNLFPPHHSSDSGIDEKTTTASENDEPPVVSAGSGRGGRRSPAMPLGPGGLFKCSQCGGAYPSRALLEKHELLHAPSTQTCKTCNKSFANVYRLQRHMISHDESALLRKFKCNDCEKAFKFKHHLKEHLRIHSGEKPFECGNCGKKFSHSGSYSSHMTSKKCLVMNLKMGRIRPNNPALNPERSPSRKRHCSSNSQTNNNTVPPNNNNSFPPILPKYNEAAVALLASMTARDGAFPTSTNPLTASALHPLYLPPGLPLHHPASIAPYSLPASLSHLLEHFATSQYMPRKLESDYNAKSMHNFHNYDAEDAIEDDDKKSSIGDESELVMDIGDEENVHIKEEKSEEFNGNDSEESHPRLPPTVNNSLGGLNMILESVNASVTKHFIEANMHKLSPHSGSSCPSVASPPAPPMTIKQDPDDSTFQCNRCNKSFSHRAELLHHEQVLCGQFFRKHEGLAAQVAETLALNRIEAEMHASINSGVSASEDEEYNKESEGKQTVESERKVRVRTAISDEQQAILKEHYARNQRPNREEFKQIAQRLGLDNRVVQVWFQNNRARVRRMNHSNNQHTNNVPIAEQPLDLSTKKSNHSTTSSPPVSPVCNANTLHSDSGEEAVNLSQKSSRSPTPYHYSYHASSYLHSNCSSTSEVRHSPSPNDRRDFPNFRLHNNFPSELAHEKLSNPYSPDMIASPSQLTNLTESDICRASSCSPASERRSWTEDSRISQDGDVDDISLPKKQRKNESKEPEGQFNCDQCDKTFVKQSSLARHKYEHSGMRPYQCIECPKAFKHKHHLTEHKRLHTGEKPFQCSKCLKKFSHSGSYSQHMNHRYSYCKPYREDHGGSYRNRNTKTLFQHSKAN